MPLRMGLQLIVQYPSSTHLVCVGFHGLAIARPVLVEFAGSGSTTSDSAAEAIGRATERWIGAHLTPPTPSMPCGGHLRSGACHAWAEIDCVKIMVVLIDAPSATMPTVAAGTIVMPVVPRALLSHAGIAALIGAHNAYAHDGDPTQALYAVLGLIGVAEEERRIFVSYARRDSHPLAEQMYDALSHAGFNVFLDRFSLPPGRDFLRRIETELSDKAMVLLIESPRSVRSVWVGHELAHARAQRMGIAAILWHGGGHAIVRPDERFTPGPRDWSRPREETLKPRALKRAVEHVERMHSHAIARRRAILRSSMHFALRIAGASSVRYERHLVLAESQTGGLSEKKYAFAVTPRTPALRDFFTLAQFSATDVRAVLGPRRFLEADRDAHLSWLDTSTSIRCRDEGLILQTARESAQGVL